MEKCGCYDPGFILGLILGKDHGRAVNTWLQNALREVPSLPVQPLSEKDAAWMGDAAGFEVLKDLVTLSRVSSSGTGQIAVLSLDIKGVPGFKEMLEQFLNLLSRQVRIVHLVFTPPGSEALQTKIHLTIRLLRSILISVHSDVQLLPRNPGSGLDKDSLWGNTLNEAHLVYNDELMRVLLQCLADQHAGILSQWAGMLRLPGTNVAYFNDLLLDQISEKAQVFPALAASLILSGLPALEGGLEKLNVQDVRRLLEARQKSPVFQTASAQMVINLDERVFALLKISPDAMEMALCLVNFTDQVVNVRPDTAALGLPETGWADLITGKRMELGETGISLDGYGAVWLCQPV